MHSSGRNTYPREAHRPRALPAASEDSANWRTRILALLSATHLQQLIDVCFPVLQRAVVCDFASVLYRSAGDVLMKERDSRGRSYGPEFMRRYGELTPAAHLAKANRGVKVLPSYLGLPKDEAHLRQLPFYQEVMKAQGWRHAVALCFWGTPPGQFPLLVATVNRASGRPDFTPADVASLEEIHPFLEVAIERVYERAAAQAICDGMATALPTTREGLLLLDSRLRTIRANPAGRRLSAAWAAESGARPQPEAESVTVPGAIVDACASLQDEWQAFLRTQPDATTMRRREVRHSEDRPLSARVTMVCQEPTGLGEPSFLVEITETACIAGSTRGVRALLDRLTSSERLVASVLADGLSNQEIADHLGKSVHAVKFLLHRIYKKTGFGNRARLVAALHGARKEGSPVDRGRAGR